MTLPDSKTVPGAYTPTPHLERDANGIWHVRGYAEAKELLLADMAQAGFHADEVLKSGLDPVLYQRGDAHRQQRAQIAKFFSPTTVAQQHAPLIEKFAAEIVADFVQAKRADLNDLTVRMAVIVAATVVGLEPSAGLVRRLDAMLHAPSSWSGLLGRLWEMVIGNWLRFSFWWFDVRPAIAAHRRQPQNDVISYMLAKGKNDIAILVECLVYGAAGMATTQEFISVVFWHCMQRPEWKQIMLEGTLEARHEFLHELLRLEPVIAKLYRRPVEAMTLVSEGTSHHIPAGALVQFHLYDINADAQVVHHNPLQAQPHRDLERGVSRSLVGFGAGPHRCAGEFIALTETDIFLRHLLALPGLRIESGPDLARNPTVEGYEIRKMMISVP